MYMGIPIVCSDMGFARAVCKNAALYCEPVNEESYAENIYKLYCDVNLRLQLIESGYNCVIGFSNSMERTKSYLRIIENMLEK